MMIALTHPADGTLIDACRHYRMIMGSSTPAIDRKSVAENGQVSGSLSHNGRQYQYGAYLIGQAVLILFS